MNHMPGMDLNTITCTAYLEELSAKGETLRKTLHRNLTFSLGRNEFRDVILCVSYTPKKETKYTLRDVLVHKKFVKDGKTTIKLVNDKIQFMLSNCAPDKLIMFLKTMATKLECQKKKGFVPERVKLVSQLPRAFQEISPLTMKDLKEANELKAKAAEKADMFTPKGKRKAVGQHKENQQPNKFARKLPLGDSNGLAGRASSSVPSAISNPVKLSKEQLKVLDIVKSGKNIFFTGSAGTGKSFLLRRIIGALPPQHTFATASTGVAACHIGGTTLHQFAGIGSGKAPLEQCVQLASRQQVAQQWRKCRHLIIDEISMVDGDLFDKLETIARVVRHSEEPFGGIQLIVCGDFLQLPPVVKDQVNKKFCFMAKTWRKCISVMLELTEVRRQSDRAFIDILQEIRLGRCPDNVSERLKSTVNHDIQQEGILATRLCTHKEDVENINKFHLKTLKGPLRTFEATDSDEAYLQMINTLSPVPAKLELTEGAQVMLAKNVDVSQGLVNGARGIVSGFDKKNEGLPIVRFMSGQEVLVKPVRWTFKVAGNLYLTRKQVPLKLAWAISIHKSQGMTLDCVEISLSKVFEAGQSYVALSRAKSLEGLRVLDFDKTCVRADLDVLKFYHKMELQRKMMNGSQVDVRSMDRPKHW